MAKNRYERIYQGQDRVGDIGVARKRRWPPLPEYRGTFEMIPKSALEVDHAYQRTAGQVERIAKDFSWQSFGVLIVIRRRDGRLMVIDGQHRAYAACMREDIDMVPCIVFPAAHDDSDSSRSEADAFLTTNTTSRRVSALDKFRAKLHSGDELAIEINNIVTECGFSVSNSTDPYRLNAITTAIKIHQYGPGILRSVLTFCAVYYDGRVQRNILIGLGMAERELQKRYGHGIDQYADKLGSDVEVMRKIQEVAALAGRCVTDSIILAAVAQMINYRRRNRIELDVRGETS